MLRERKKTAAVSRRVCVGPRTATLSLVYAVTRDRLFGSQLRPSDSEEKVQLKSKYIVNAANRSIEKCVYS
jgi:hypothetical protein